MPRGPAKGLAKPKLSPAAKKACALASQRKGARRTGSNFNVATRATRRSRVRRQASTTKKAPVERKPRKPRTSKKQSQADLASFEFADTDIGDNYEEKKYQIDSDDSSDDDLEDVDVRKSTLSSASRTAQQLASEDFKYLSSLSDISSLPESFRLISDAELRANFDKAQKAMDFEANSKNTREHNAATYGTLSKVQVMLCAVKPSSQKQYMSNMSTVVKHGHSWTVEGLTNFLLDGKVAAKVNNTSCQSIVSTFKFFYAIQHGGRSLSLEDEDSWRIIIRGRKNCCPDIPRIVGALTRARLLELHDLYKLKLQRGAITAEEYQELLDASTMMYACALRIFQLRLLSKGSFAFRKDDTEAWVSVRAKNTKNQRFVETKEVHPEFVQQVKEIVSRRSKDTTLFPLWHKPLGSTAPSQLKYEKLMKSFNLEAAHLFGWPSCLAFHGTHNFRHGAAQDAFQDGTLDTVMLRTGHVSQGCALHYARSDMERFKSAEFFALNASGRAAEVANWVETCRENARKAAENLRPSSGMGTSSRPHPSVEQENERIELCRSVEAHRYFLTNSFPMPSSTLSSKRAAREDEDRLFCKREDVATVQVFNCRTGRFVDEKVPKAALKGYLVPKMVRAEFQLRLSEFYRDFPDAAFKKVHL